MPELTAVHIGMLGLVLVAGGVLGWFLRADHCAKEKISINAGWQEKFDSQQSEVDRLAEQNRSLMEQISQYQAAHKDYANRTRELADSLREALASKDRLQRQLKDTRANLDVTIAQRDKLHAHLQGQPTTRQAAALKEKDDKIFRLSKELSSWQSRVPPLVERFQARNKEADELAAALQQANSRIAVLEEKCRFDQTRIEALDADSLPDGGDASNEPISDDGTNMASDSNTGTRAQDPWDIGSALSNHLPGEADSTSQAGSTLVDEDWNDESADAREAPEIDSPDGTVPSSGTADDGEATYSYADTSGSVAVDTVEPADESANGADYVDAEEAIMPDSGAEPNPGEGTSSEIDSADETVAATDANGGGHPESTSDDLKEIKGIGPAIEKTLHDLGITSFRQIANMGETEIDRVAQQLRGFRSRIYREDWIGQARYLQYQKYGTST